MSNELTLVMMVGPAHVRSWSTHINLPATVQILIINCTGDKLINPNSNWRIIAPPITAKFFDHKHRLISDFAAARNWSLGQVATKWVIFLDGDEQVAEKDWPAVLTAITNLSITGYFLPRRDILADQVLSHGETSGTQFLRLFQTQHGQWRGLVHETVTCSGTTAPLDLVINHESHTDLTQFISQISYYAGLVASKRVTPRWLIVTQMLVYPWAKLVVNLVIKSAWRDGWRGVAYAYIMSLHSLSVRIYQWEKYG